MKIDWTNKAQVKATVKNFPAIFGQELRAGVMGMGDLLVGTIVELTPVGNGDGQWGHLSNSIAAGEPIRTQAGWKVEVGTPAAYASTIEYGRQPGAAMPPLEAIAKWVWGKRWAFPDVKTEKDAAQLAFPIARKIAAAGFSTAAQGAGKGWGMFGEAMKKDAESIQQLALAIRARIEARCNKAAGNG